jgi:hypothetical protein
MRTKPMGRRKRHKAETRHFAAVANSEVEIEKIGETPTEPKA